MSGNYAVMHGMLLQRGQGADEQRANVSQRTAGAGPHVSGAPVVTGAPFKVPRNVADEVRCQDTHTAAGVGQMALYSTWGLWGFIWRVAHA